MDSDDDEDQEGRSRARRANLASAASIAVMLGLIAGGIYYSATRWVVLFVLGAMLAIALGGALLRWLKAKSPRVHSLFEGAWYLSLFLLVCFVVVGGMVRACSPGYDECDNAGYRWQC